ncbi:MAG: GtrA family protein [Caulobacteraceae bacterium]|nr:GtrA family protein [Caulobacteraceae bacterium]
MTPARFLREINWFVVVGVVATALHVATALAVQRLAAAGPMAASIAGYAASVGLSYVGNSLLTFRRPVMHGPQFAKFAAISLAGLALNQAIVFVCAHLIGWPLWQALIPVALIVPAATFLMSKFWAFRAPTLEPAE